MVIKKSPFLDKNHNQGFAVLVSGFDLQLELKQVPLLSGVYLTHRILVQEGNWFILDVHVPLTIPTRLATSLLKTVV